MKTRICLMMLLLSGLTVVPAAMADGPTTLPTKATQIFVHEASGTQFPPTVATFARQQAHSFDAANLDVSVGYNDPSVRVVATIYVYPADARGSLNDQLKNIASNVLQLQPGAKQISEGSRRVIQGSREFSAREAVFDLSQTIDGQPMELRSRAILILNGKNVVKFRITYVKAEADDAEKRIDAFLAALTLP